MLRHKNVLAAAGVALGLAGAAASSHVLASMLFAITPTDVPTFVATGVLLLAVGLAASWAPARRAARVDPLIALKD